MWSLITSGVNYLLGWVFRGAVIKFVVLGAIFYVLQLLWEAAKALLPTDAVASIVGAFQGIPTDIQFYLALFQLHIGLPIIFAAVLARFAIRRLPIVG